MTLDVNQLKKAGGLRSGTSGTIEFNRAFGGKLVVGFYTLGKWLGLSHDTPDSAGKLQTIHQTIEIVEKPCRYGGTRPFFRCNCIWNGARCDKLAVKLLWQGGYFICRRCRQVPYASQSEDPLDRARQKAIDAKRKLGGANWWNYRKPKGMWWSTYGRNVLEARRTYEHAAQMFVDRCIADFAETGSPMMIDEEGRLVPKQ